MDLSDELELVHQPVRLQIMGLLYRARDLGFTQVRDRLELTDGNLASHAGRLEEGGLLESRRALTADGFEKRFAITGEGSRVFRAYVSELAAFLETVGGGPGEDASVASEEED